MDKYGKIEKRYVKKLVGREEWKVRREGKGLGQKDKEREISRDKIIR